MFSLRPAAKPLTRLAVPTGGAKRSMVLPVKKALIKAGATEEPEDVPALEKKMEDMYEKDSLMVFDSGTNLPDPVLPYLSNGITRPLNPSYTRQYALEQMT